MTDANTGEDQGKSIQLDPGSGSAFSTLMDFLVPEESGEASGEGGEATEPSAAGGGSPEPADQGAGAEGSAAGAPAGGDDGGTPVAGEPAAGSGEPAAAGDGGEPAPAGAAGTGDVDAASLEPQWGEVLTGLESKTTQEFTDQAVQSVREEYSGYIQAIEQHPRLLIGQSVPKADGTEGEEHIRDESDAKSWQDAIRHQLAREVQFRVQKSQDDNRGMMETLTNSIELFRNNADLIPGTKQFDKELADLFTETVKDYELRPDGKLVGYTINVAPLLVQVRNQLARTRTAAAAAKPAEPTAQQQRAAAQARNEQGQFNASGPQAGITSKAGGGAPEGESLDTLFGTLGIPPGTFRF